MLTILRFILFVLPGSLGTRLAIATAGKRFNYRMRDEEEHWLRRVERFSYGDGKIGWKTGRGPLVILVHGYGGCAAQWYKVAGALVKAGYSVVAPDITSHGQSAGEKITFRNFIDDLRELQNYMGKEVYAYIGHSAGGLCMMAARRLKGLDAKKYICISAPSYPYPPIKVMRKKLAPPEKVIKGYKKYLADQFECTWDNLVTQCFHYKTGNNMLVIFDRNDKYLNPGDLENIKQYWPNAQELITEGYGHEQLLRSRECIEVITDFLKQKASQSASKEAITL